MTAHDAGQRQRRRPPRRGALSRRTRPAPPLDVLAEAYAALGRSRPTRSTTRRSPPTAAPAEASVYLRLAQLRSGRRPARRRLAVGRDSPPPLPRRRRDALLARRPVRRGGPRRRRPSRRSRRSPRSTARPRSGSASPASTSAPETARSAAAPPPRRRPSRPPAPPPRSEPRRPTGRRSERRCALAIVAADPRRLDAWADALTALAAAADPRAAETADEATLLFPTVPSILAPAAEAYLAAGRRRPTPPARPAPGSPPSRRAPTPPSAPASSARSPPRTR